jgi:hypothetical protein
MTNIRTRVDRMEKNLIVDTKESERCRILAQRIAEAKIRTAGHQKKYENWLSSLPPHVRAKIETQRARFKEVMMGISSRQQKRGR